MARDDEGDAVFCTSSRDGTHLFLIAKGSGDADRFRASDIRRSVETRLQALGTPAGEAAYRFISKRIEGYDATQPMHRAGAAPVHDALAVCAIIDPSVITTRFAHVDVETSGGLTMGRTVCDFRFSGRTPAEANFAYLPPNVEFALDADEPKFVAMLLDILGRTA